MLPLASATLLPATRRRALTVSVIDGLMHAVMLGVTENYLGALAVELGHSPTHQALLTTVPILAGATSQLAAPTLTHWFGSRKRFVVVCAALQAMTHLWFISIAANETRALMPLLLAKVLYYVGGNSMAPAWSSWMATLTAGPGRERFFALRSGAIQAVLLAAFALGGSWLDHTGDRHMVLDTYVKLFWLGLLARSISAGLLASQYDPHRHLDARPKQRLRIRHTLEHADFRVAIYIALLMFGANIAVPFFVPYWLEELKLGYRQYSLLVGTSVLLKALTLPVMHRVAERLGMDRLLYTAGFTVAVLPATWAIASSFPHYVLIQVVSGTAWGAIEYASFQLLLKSSDENVRLEFLSLAGSINGVGSILGSILGSALLEHVGLSYIDVFWASTVVRGTPLILAALLARTGKKLMPL